MQIYNHTPHPPGGKRERKKNSLKRFQHGINKVYEVDCNKSYPKRLRSGCELCGIFRACRPFLDAFLQKKINMVISNMKFCMMVKLFRK